jgi:hypothetical protein
MLSAHRDNRELEVGRDREEDSYNNCWVMKESRYIHVKKNKDYYFISSNL